MVERELIIPVDDGTEYLIYSLSPSESKKAFGVQDAYQEAVEYN